MVEKMSDELRRLEFEKWITSQQWFKATIGLACNRSGDGYLDPCINSRWQGWRAAHLTTPVQTVDVEAVREVIATLRKCGWLEDANKLSQAIGDKT